MDQRKAAIHWGYIHGFRAAREVLERHGRLLCQENARHLALDKSRDAFSVGYRAGFRNALK